MQQAINEIFDAAGLTGIGDAGRKVYSSVVYIADGDDRKVAIGKLDNALSGLATTVAGKEDKPTLVTAFTIVDSQVAAANVTGILLDKTLYRSARIEWQVYRKSTTQTRVQRGMLFAIHDDTTWTLNDGPLTGVDAGVTFSIDTATGQITYTSDANGGVYSAATSILSMVIDQKMEL